MDTQRAALIYKDKKNKEEIVKLKKKIDELEAEIRVLQKLLTQKRD